MSIKTSFECELIHAKSQVLEESRECFQEVKPQTRRRRRMFRNDFSTTGVAVIISARKPTPMKTLIPN
jgi:hypothetical protein